jgi:hypothetical protein
MNKIGISEFHYSQNTYTRAGKSYQVTDLIELAKNIDPFDMPIAGIDIGVQVWGYMDIKGFCYHVLRMNKADHSFPVILDDTGYICDGWHRLAKAIIEGKETIKAIRLTVMPEPINKEE